MMYNVISGVIFLKKYIPILTITLCLLFAGCSGNSPEESALSQSTGTQSERIQTAEEITEAYTTWEAVTTPDGEPVITDYQGTFYRYAGRRWWKDLDQPAGSFILKDDGKYYPYLDEENDPGAAINPEFNIYQTVESFNEGGWEYAGTIDGKDFYVDGDLETMLCFIDVTDNQNDTSGEPDGGKMFLVGILKPSAIDE